MSNVKAFSNVKIFTVAAVIAALAGADMRRPDEEVEVAAELRMPSEAAAECAWAEAAAGRILAERPGSVVGRLLAACVAAAGHAWAAFVSAARLASPAGRRYRTLQRVPLSAASVRLRLAAVRTAPRR
jgi:hypothetical protein